MEKVNAARPAAPRQGKPKKKRHGVDFALRIVAVIAAVLVWFILSITQYPTVNKSISSVPVTLSLEGTIAKEKGLSALNFKSIAVDVEIKGMNYVIGNYKASDLQATVDVSKVTKEGHYELDIDVQSTHSGDSCTIVSVSPSKIQIDFDRITEKQLPIEVEAPNVSAQDGYTLKDSTVNPETLTITGPENTLDKVTKAVAKVSRTAKINEDTTIKADEVSLCDSDGNTVVDSSISRDEEQSFSVNFIVYKKKTLKFTVEVTGAPDNFDASSLPLSYSESEMTILTPKLSDSATETVTLGTIPLSQINLGWSQTYDVPLSEGEVTLSGESKVTVSIDSASYTTAVFKVSSIIAKNRPSGKSVSIETLSLPAVTLIGPINEISNISENDLVASVDMTGITNNGSYSKPATVSISNHNTVWCFGSNDVQIVVVSDPRTTTTTAATTSTPEE